MSVKNKTNKNYKRSQKGRSMVEMLGVLAIVGVLSVGGVYGYGVAMKKHKANQLLHEASMQAATVSAQIMSGKDPTGLTDFGTGNNITLDTDSIAGQTTFKLTISDIDSAICEQMKNSKGGMVRDVDCDESGNATITYYKNLATNDEEGKNSPIGGSGEDDDTKPTTCPTGSSTEGTGGSTGIKIDGVLCQCDDKNAVYTSNGCEVRTSDTCDDHTANQCGLGYYCQFDPWGCGNSERGDGVCTAVGSGTSIKGGAYLQGPQTDWWSAYSWCKGNGMEPVTGAITIADGTEIQLNSSYSNINYSGNGPLYQYFGEDVDFEFWTGHDYGGSCYAWYVGANPESELVSADERTVGWYALCE